MKLKNKNNYKKERVGEGGRNNAYVYIVVCERSGNVLS